MTARRTLSLRGPAERRDCVPRAAWNVSETRRERLSGVFLFALLNLSLMLIIDVDRPDGGINVSQRPMEDLQATLRAQPPAIFDAPTVGR